MTEWFRTSRDIEHLHLALVFIQNSKNQKKVHENRGFVTSTEEVDYTRTLMGAPLIDRTLIGIAADEYGSGSSRSVISMNVYQYKDWIKQEVDDYFRSTSILFGLKKVLRIA